MWIKKKKKRKLKRKSNIFPDDLDISHTLIMKYYPVDQNRKNENKEGLEQGVQLDDSRMFLTNVLQL